MRRVSGRTLPTVARICALIARRPTPAYLVAARLHEPTDAVLTYDDHVQQTNRGCGCGRCTPPVLALDARSPGNLRAAPVTLDAIIEMAYRYPLPPCRA